MQKDLQYGGIYFMSKKTKQAFFLLSFKGKEKVGKLEKETMKKWKSNVLQKEKRKPLHYASKKA